MIVVCVEDGSGASVGVALGGTGSSVTASHEKLSAAGGLFTLVEMPHVVAVVATVVTYDDWALCSVANGAPGKT
jgi:hypothetical protein